MVIKDCFALASDVSPQTPISFLSWIILQPLRQAPIASLSIEKDLPRDEPVEGKRVNGGIGIDHEHVFVEGRVHTNNILDLVVNFKLQRVHWRIEVNLDFDKPQHKRVRRVVPPTLFKKCMSNI